MVRSNSLRSSERLSEASACRLPPSPGFPGSHSPGKALVTQAASQEVEGLDGGQQGQLRSLWVQRMVRGEAGGRAVLVDASPGWLGTAQVETAPMATLPWVGE